MLVTYPDHPGFSLGPGPKGSDFCPRDFGQNWSQTLTARNFVNIGPFKLVPKPSHRGQKALQNGSKMVKNRFLLTTLWANKVNDQ